MNLSPFLLSLSFLSRALCASSPYFSDASASVSEAGPTSDTLGVTLTESPTGSIALTLSFDPQQVTAVFTSTGTTTVMRDGTNWNAEVSVNVTAVDDALLEADPHFSRVAVSTTGSTDGVYSCGTGTCTDVNAYTALTGATTSAGAATITVADGSSFADGDEILVWQAQAPGAAPGPGGAPQGGPPCGE